MYLLYTEWKVWDASTQSYKHNHIEIGWNHRIKPLPTSDSQMVWLQQKWAKKNVMTKKGE